MSNYNYQPNQKNSALHGQYNFEHTMGTTIERAFRRINVNIPGIAPGRVFVEVQMHFIVFRNKENEVVSQRLDKQVLGQLYRAMRPDESGSTIHGEVMYTLPGGEETIRLVGLGIEYSELQRI